MAQITSTTLANGLPLHRIHLPGTRGATLLVASAAGARRAPPPPPPPPAPALPPPRLPLPGTRATTILVAFDAGARTERPEENGMAHFLEHLVFKGGGDFPAAPPGTGAPRR